MKSATLRLEKWLLSAAFSRLVVNALVTLVKRVLWLWGRVRFGALVRKRGLGCVCHWNAEIKYPDNITLGERVVIGTNVTLGAHSPITLGNNVRLSRDVIVETAGLDFSTQAPPYQHISKPIVLEDGVWIGARSIILGGVTIGQNAVVAAGSIVTRSVPSGALVVGIPARQIKR